MGRHHNHWLGLASRGSEIVLDETNQLQVVIDQLPNPDNRHPSLLVLIGQKQKRMFMKEFFPSAKKECISDRKPKRPIQLLLDPSTIFNERPLLYADCPLPDQIASNTICEDCPDIVSRTIQKIDHCMPDTVQVTQNMYSQLLAPFADVVCLFYEDFNNLDSVAEFLASWMDNVQVTTTSVKPHHSLMLVVERYMPGARLEMSIKTELVRCLSHQTTLKLSSHFSDVNVVTIFPHGQLSSSTRWRRLKERLRTATNQATVRRMQAKMLFSATHFSVFFKYACDHFVTMTHKPFDFITASRFRNPVSPTLEAHLLRFLLHFSSMADLIEVAVPIVSSTLLLDAYPPDMHLFHGIEVFNTLYRDICLRVGRKRSHQVIELQMLSPSGLVKLIEEQFSLRFQQVIEGSVEKSAVAHRQILSRFRHSLYAVADHELCSMICLQRPPDHNLPCKHAICDICIQIHVQSTPHDPWLYELEGCPFCHSVFQPKVVVKMHNPSRGLRVLCLDGGGCRGIIPLRFLQVLEDRVGLPYPVQQNFDIFIAPSSGALSILALVIIGVPVNIAIQIFEVLAEKAFEPRQILLPGPFWLWELVQRIVSFLAGGKYPAAGIETAVKQVFGEDLTMFDCSHATEIGAKIAVLATSVIGCKPFLFTNYRGKRLRLPDCGEWMARACYTQTEINDAGYRVVNESGPRVWEIARCTSAAPGYFTPYRIASTGSYYQDGGLWMNDPTSLVDSEIKAISSNKDEPLVVSVGTGFVEEAGRETIPPEHRGNWKNGLIYRLYEALVSSVSSKRYWRSGNNYFRFDISFCDKLPELDDTHQIPIMANTADEQFRDSSRLSELVSRLIAAHFHFELDDVPRKAGDRIMGAGHIFCDLKKGHPAYDVLLDKLIEGDARFSFDGIPISGRIRDRSFLDGTGNVRQRVEFVTTQETVSVQLETLYSEPQQISGSPFCIKTRVRDQNLDSFFGQVNHRKRRYSSQNSESRSRKRRRIHWQRLVNQ